MFVFNNAIIRGGTNVGHLLFDATTVQEVIKLMGGELATFIGSKKFEHVARFFLDHSKPSLKATEGQILMRKEVYP